MPPTTPDVKWDVWAWGALDVGFVDWKRRWVALGLGDARTTLGAARVTDLEPNIVNCVVVRDVVRECFVGLLEVMN